MRKPKQYRTPKTMEEICMLIFVACFAVCFAVGGLGPM